MRTRDRRFWTTVASVLSLLLVLSLHAGVVLSRDGDLSWDDSNYLQRGLYHARQVREKGNLELLRLAYSLRFESPKPPGFTAILAISALGSNPSLRFVLLAGTSGTLAILVLSLGYCLGSRARTWKLPLALALALTSPALFRLSLVAMVEVLLSAVVLLAAAGLMWWLDSPRPAHATAYVAGAAGALLTKTTGAVAPLALLLSAAYSSARGLIPRSRVLAIVAQTLLAVAVASTWYWFNWLPATRHIAAAARYQEYLGSLPASLPARAWVVFSKGLGPALPLLTLLAPGFFEARIRTLGQRVMVLAVLIAGSLLVVFSLCLTYAESRFVAPVAPWLATAFVMSLPDRLDRRRRVFLTAITVLGLTVSIPAALVRRPNPTPWFYAECLSAAGSTSAQVDVGVLGSTAGVNVYKVRLLGELSEHPERIRVRELSRLAASDLARHLSEMEVVVVVEVPEASRDSIPGLNLGYRESRRLLAQRDDFERSTTCSSPDATWLARKTPRD